MSATINTNAKSIAYRIPIEYINEYETLKKKTGIYIEDTFIEFFKDSLRQKFNKIKGSNEMVHTNTDKKSKK